jgi:hypothetical protein
MDALPRPPLARLHVEPRPASRTAASAWACDALPFLLEPVLLVAHGLERISRYPFFTGLILVTTLRRGRAGVEDPSFPRTDRSPQAIIDSQDAEASPRNLTHP